MLKTATSLMIHRRIPFAVKSLPASNLRAVQSVRYLSFNKERLEFDITSDETDKPELFDDWGSDLDVVSGRIDRVRRERKVDETGAASGRGKRKRAQAVAKIRDGEGEITVNGRPHVEYFSDWGHRAQLLVPFEVTGTAGKFDVELELKGGGATGQAEAARLAISKALQNFEPNHRTKLKREYLLTTDIRRVQPKKWGRTKARRAWQWVKR
mmetsp:Transcript_6417/g.8827  ORF Transcript_6417/g.8827 Transcript_6417/m.8827 type:complete len:211 (+) Transcript_6417:191-823(+)